MKKLLYISILDYKDPRNLGVVKKIEGQKKAFEKLGYHVDQIKLVDCAVYVNDKKILTISGRLDFFFFLPVKLYSHFKQYGQRYDLVYLRKSYFTPLYYFLFHKLRNLADRFVLEIPTYPFSRELKGKWLAKRLDDLSNIQLKLLVHKIITTQQFSKIWGIDTIQIKNGYDFSRQVTTQWKKEDNTIQFITVANISFWHGLERMLQGIHEYDRSRDNNAPRIYFHIVGTGPEIPALLALKSRLGLETIIFHGPRDGQELDEIYMSADIGVGSLGLYKKNTTFQSPLKNMEFCFYGLPFIIANTDPDLSHLDFVLEVPNADRPIDIKHTVEWFRHIRSTSSDIKKKGAELYSWDKQISIIEEEL